jgi:hypothetical protein
MWGAVELSDIHDIVLILQYRGFVVVDVQIVGGREDGHNGRKLCCSSLAVHAISRYKRRDIRDLPSVLGFVGSYYRQEIVPFKELTRCIIAEIISQGTR